MAREHEFQAEARPRNYTPRQLAIVPRNIREISTSSYADLPADLIPASLGVGGMGGAGGAGGAVQISQFEQILNALQRKSNFQQLVVSYTTAAVLILPQAARSYMLIQNLDAAANLYVGFGFVPSGSLARGVKLIPGGSYEPFQVPQNDIWISGDANGSCTILIANG